MLADVDRARDAVAEVRDLRGGTLGFGMFGTASAYLIADLAAEFRRQYPEVRLRLVGLNSSEVADQVRDAKLEAGLIVLPVDDAGLDLRVARLEELVVVSRAEPRRRAGDDRGARRGAADPLRRPVRGRRPDATAARRASAAGRSDTPAGDRGRGDRGRRRAARRGLGDTIVPRAAISRQGARGLHFASFADPLYDTFAFIARSDAPLSPAARAFVEIAERRLERVAEAALYAAGTSEKDR